VKYATWFAVALLTAGGYSQHTTTTMLVQVTPEAYLVPKRIPLHFQVLADGSSVTAQTESITAWVRTLPGKAVRITARPITGLALSWSGTVMRATQGAKAASCTSGMFEAATPGELVSGWSQSGVLTCAVTFTLAEAKTLPVGIYTTTVDLSISP